VLRVELDRIDGSVALPSLRPENASVRGDEAMIELRLAAGQDIELYFPAPGGAIDPAWLGLAGEVLAHLAGMDNEVQRSCAEACVRERHRPRNYESELAYITLTGPDAAVLHYFGTGVNTEWDERFARTGGRWCRA
jgi:hypothetical protein